ncbi:hypothetical protein AAHC03_020807 [Spirometra sp. Aus1]
MSALGTHVLDSGHSGVDTPPLTFAPATLLPATTSHQTLMSEFRDLGQRKSSQQRTNSPTPLVSGKLVGVADKHGYLNAVQNHFFHKSIAGPVSCRSAHIQQSLPVQQLQFDPLVTDRSGPVRHLRIQGGTQPHAVQPILLKTRT